MVDRILTNSIMEVGFVKSPMKSLLAALLAGVLVFSCAACADQQAAAPDASPKASEAVEPAVTPAAFGEAKEGTGTAVGFGGEVTVTLTVRDGVVIEAVAVGESETEGVGSLAIEQMPKAMVQAGTVEVDGVSGATVTSSAVLAAARKAYAEATGTAVETAEVRMMPGTYSNYVWAFSVDTKMEVIVTVNETSIKSIQIGLNGETQPILENAMALLIPRILSSQSYAVDAITGATATSNGIKQGVKLAVGQALAAAGTDLSAASAFETVPEKVTGVTKELDYDVLVIGMGGTGTAAAMSAAEAQKAAGRPVSVLAIDKAGKYGGTSAVTSEMMAINPPRFMKAHNYEVSKIQVGVFSRELEDTRTDKSVYVVRSEMLSDWIKDTEGDAKQEMIELMLDHSGETLDWLMYDHGFYFGKPQLGVDITAKYFCVYEYNNSFMDNKHIIASYFDHIWKDYKELGGEYMLETEAYKLIYDPGTGTVSGAYARGADGTEYVIHAKSVILCTGGFIGNGEMTASLLKNPYYPLDGAYNVVGMTQNDGKMIQAALDIGAGTYNIDMTPIVHIAGSKVLLHAYDRYTVEIDGEDKTVALNDIPMIMAVSPNVLAVDRKGKRFCDESRISFLDSWKGGTTFYSIWSADQIENVKKNGFEYVTVGAFINQGGVPAGYPIDNIYDVIDTAIQAGAMMKFDTLEDMANSIGMDPAVLKATVETYNAACASGTDAEFGKAADYLKAIGDGPYYVSLGAPYAYSTCGGLDVNTDFQVLSAEGNPIPGLYAAGTDCLGVLLSNKKAYLDYGGTAQGWAFTSGRLAGASAAGYAGRLGG